MYEIIPVYVRVEYFEGADEHVLGDNIKPCPVKAFGPERVSFITL